MKRPVRSKQTQKPDESIDVKYGLEPVIDLNESPEDDGTPGGMQFHLVECPYCGESFETSIDTSAGSARYVEDCQVCCQPIEFIIELSHDGVLQSLSTLRSDQ